jgi:hypothetical protein
MVKKPVKNAAAFTTSMTTNEAPDAVTETAPKIDAGFAALSGVTYPSVDDPVEDEDAAQLIGVEPDHEAAPEPERMTKDAFWVMFKGSFKVASVLPFVGIPELAIANDEVEHGRVASDAIFDLLEMYFPSFFDRDREVLGLLIAAGSFLIMKAVIVKAVLEARTAQKIADQNVQKQQRNQPQPAPQPQTAPPQGQAAPAYDPVEMVEWAA